MTSGLLTAPGSGEKGMGAHAVGRRGRKAPIQTFLETVEKPTPQRPSPTLHERGEPAGHSSHGLPQRPVPENSRRGVGDANGPPLSMASLAESLQANTCDAHLGLPRSWALVKGPGCRPRTAPVSLGRAGSGGRSPSPSTRRCWVLHRGPRAGRSALSPHSPSAALWQGLWEPGQPQCRWAG